MKKKIKKESKNIQSKTMNSIFTPLDPLAAVKYNLINKWILKLLRCDQLSVDLSMRLFVMHYYFPYIEKKWSVMIGNLRYSLNSKTCENVKMLRSIQSTPSNLVHSYWIVQKSSKFHQKYQFRRICLNGLVSLFPPTKRRSQEPKGKAAKNNLFPSKPPHSRNRHETQREWDGKGKPRQKPN